MAPNALAQFLTGHGVCESSSLPRMYATDLSVRPRRSSTFCNHCVYRRLLRIPAIVFYCF
jgi:hypothetical protein